MDLKQPTAVKGFDMDKVIVKTNNPMIRELQNQTMKVGYEAIYDCEIPEIPTICASHKDVHGLLVDRELITPEEVRQLRETLQNELFPIILFAGDMTDPEAGAWIGAGVSEILQLPMPAPLIGKRIGNVIRMYCMSGQSRDRLTGLYNRHAFYHFAREMILADPEAEYTIIISDIEHFKLINERFGEETGDQLLKYVGDSLSAMNGEDVLFARYGGDEFVGIMKRNTSEVEQSEAPLANGMEFMYANAPVEHFEAKFGIYDNVDKSLPISIMCDRAMVALKTIKSQYGRMLAKYTPQMQQKFLREQQIVDSMEEAIRQEQFQVYYQPKHSAVTSEVIGVEALVRWEHPSFGFMSPGEFIPLFERNGFISKLDLYVWNQVCKDVKRWQQMGLPVVPVSVNASRRDIIQEKFVEAIAEPLKKYEVDPAFFHMEITESIFMEDAEILAPTIKDLQEHGIRIELDDFGSGFSSLGILSKLPLDIIKLDISLIRNLEAQPQIVESIIQLMHTLGYGVIAEGVETDYQLELLQQMGCDGVQGYFYSKPLTFNGLKKYMEQFADS